jgi:hypothetical protein
MLQAGEPPPNPGQSTALANPRAAKATTVTKIRESLAPAT